jgi:hypothetical protein
LSPGLQTEREAWQDERRAWDNEYAFYREQRGHGGPSTPFLELYGQAKEALLKELYPPEIE